jgi:type VI secretion system secreted protein VgrG
MAHPESAMPSAASTQYFTQSNKTLKFFCPLNDDVLLLQRFTGTERISRLYQFSLTLLAEDYKPVVFEQLVGKQATVHLTLPDGTPRPFDGIISRFSQSNPVVDDNGIIAFYRYEAELVPKVWLLTQRVRSRVFQHKSVPDILATVFDGYDIKPDYMNKAEYKPRDYCVQYRETDFAFASRLMEEEGIYYYFTHEDKKHTMNLVDSTMKLSEIKDGAKVPFRTVYGDMKEDELVVQWEKTQEVRPGSYELRDWNFALYSDLEATSQVPPTLQVGAVTHKLTGDVNSSLLIDDHPGEYGERFDEGQRNDCFTESSRVVRLKMERETLPGLVIRGAGNSRRFSAGAKFTLADHFDANGSYLLTRVDYLASVGEAYSGGNADSMEFANTFECVSAEAVYRPARVTPKPRIDGTQTAKVVGMKDAADDDIVTDEYARVMVRFPWDSAAESDKSTSCWIRVGTFWAGATWGGIHIPRVGQEVIVAFMEGDPDRPLIIGSVYNEKHRPPYALPSDKTQSGVKSRSSIESVDGEGTSQDTELFNELRFEDKKGSEQIYFHAERDFLREVENNDTLVVGMNEAKGFKDGNQTITIYKDRTTTIKTGNETLTVEKGNRTVTVSEGNDKHEVTQGKRDVIVESDDTHHVKTGNRLTTIDTGNDTHEIKTGNRKVTINTGNDTLTLEMGSQKVEIQLGNQSTKLDVGSSTTEAMTGITLKVGGSSVEINQMGVTIKGMMVKIQGEVMLQAKGTITQVNGDAILMCKGGITMIN